MTPVLVFSYHTHDWPISMCVHALLSSLLMVFIFISPACSACYGPAYNSKCTIFVSQLSVSMAYDIYLSSSPPILVITI
ncbi:hypothetical protein EDB84DRAFT_1472272 [Lactarius hengduanensis]|nr:hypothetical protein EDB84DRAFT_1472272 [Lactarius hengduanensis]